MAFQKMGGELSGGMVTGLAFTADIGGCPDIYAAGSVNLEQRAWAIFAQRLGVIAPQCGNRRQIEA